jgi:hypothetical protein
VFGIAQIDLAQELELRIIRSNFHDRRRGSFSNLGARWKACPCKEDKETDAADWS